MNVAILVPRRAGVAERDRLWEFTRQRWENDHPDWEIIEGHHEEGPFNRAAAINAAASRAPDADVFLIIDADVLVDPHAVRSTVDVAACTHGLVVASPERWMLTKQGTAKILGGYTGPWDALVRTRYGIREDPNGAQCSCCIAVSRQLWEQVGGFDELHVGYGWEDVSFRNACESVAGKATVWLAPHPIWHLHHAPSPEDRQGGALKSANEARARRYIAAHGDADATRLLIDEHLAARQGADAEPGELGATRIPRILHRTVPAETSEEVEQWWQGFADLHPGWQLNTWRDPLDPADWPLTSHVWDRCKSGAQRAGLLRLEYLVRFGGFHIDADMEPVRSLEPLTRCEAVAAWEDPRCIPDAFLGCSPNHPAFVLMLEKAVAAVEGGADAWNSGPGVTTEVLSAGRGDCVVFPPGIAFDVHYLEKSELKTRPKPPWSYMRHHWHGSWLSPKQRASIDKRQRA